MATGRVISGARCVVNTVDSQTGKAHPVGIWNNFSYSITYDVQPSFILGRYNAAELTTTGVEPVSITAQGWRVLDHGPFADGKLTNLADLLNQEGVTMMIYDRQTPSRIIAQIKDCKPTGHSSTISAKQLVESTVTMVGLLLTTESNPNDDVDSTSTNLPNPT